MKRYKAFFEIGACDLETDKEGTEKLAYPGGMIRKSVIFQMKGKKKMHYVLGDIHNEVGKLSSILEQIQLKSEDELFLLGDVFDRGVENPDPVGTYSLLSGVQGKCTWIRGNHDQWLADYIFL